MFDIHKELEKMPGLPGVYIMKNNQDKIIYVGKAKVLKNRVRQYFQSSKNHAIKTIKMVEEISSFEYIITDSENEAFFLEDTLIKKHSPKYNIKLKDDKTYPYIKINTSVEYPYIEICRQRKNDNAKYFGPYISVKSIREVIEIIKSEYGIRTCKKNINSKKIRPCLNYHIKTCIGPCTGNVDKDEYNRSIDEIIEMLSGKETSLIDKLEKQMYDLSERKDYEHAAKIRDRLLSLKSIMEKQKVASGQFRDRDIIACAIKYTDVSICLFYIREGKLVGRHSLFMENILEESKGAVLQAFIKQFYSKAKYVPKEIFLSDEIEEQDVLSQWLSKEADKKIYIKIPKQGNLKKLVNMAETNAKHLLSRKLSESTKKIKIAKEGLDALCVALKLELVPDRIEAYDVSNIGNEDKTASMVVFNKGIINKGQYRRFRIREEKKQNDYACMREAIKRRFIGSLKDMPFPDLILVDGGVGHISTITELLKELKIDIPIVGMSKDNKHKSDILIMHDMVIYMKENIELLRFITSVQNEAHRFTIEYTRKLSRKRQVESELDKIKGIGDKKKSQLIKYFGSVNKIKEASIEELFKAEGISNVLAKIIYEYFNGDEK